MATTSTKPANLNLYEAAGSFFAATRTVTIGAYTTGGVSMPASQFNLRLIRRVEAPVITTSTGAAAPVYSIRPLVAAAGTVLLKVMVAADGESDLVEAANALDLSGLVAVITAHGV